MFEQSFLSPQLKRSMIIRNKHGIYELSHKLLERELENLSKKLKLHSIIAQCSVFLPNLKFF